MVAGLGTYYLISCPLFFIYYTASHSPSPSLCGSVPRFQKEKAGQSTAGCEKFQQLQALNKCVFKSNKKNIYLISVFMRGLTSASLLGSNYILSMEGFHLFDSLSANKEPRFPHHHTSDSFDSDGALMRLKTRNGGC